MQVGLLKQKLPTVENFKPTRTWRLDVDVSEEEKKTNGAVNSPGPSDSVICV